ncbi:MAG: alpha-2-macroglobulin family protein [Polyangiales bacterium]
MLRRLTCCLLWILGIQSVFLQSVEAQEDALEVTLPSGLMAYEGTPLVVQGQAFRVSGLAELTPAAREIELGFRHGEPPQVEWQRVTSDAQGLFTAEVAIPGRDAGELVIRAPGAERESVFAVTPAPRTEIVFQTDRRHYESDEDVHAWALVRDALSGEPRAGARVVFRLHADPGQSEATAISGPSGVAHHVFEASSVRRGDAEVRAYSRGTSASKTVRFGQRESQPLFVALTVPEEATQPGGNVVVRVEARSQTGEPIEGALVEVQVEEREAVQVRSDAAGMASVEVQVPVLSSPFGVGVVARVSHPVHGRAEGRESILVARRGSFQLSLAPRHGALMDGVASEVWLSVHSNEGPAADQSVTIRGARGFETRVQTNEHGVARFEVRASLDDAAPTSDCERGVYFELALSDAPGDTRHKCVAVSDAPVRASLREHIAAPGEELHVDIQRRRVRGPALPVVVQLIAGSPDGYGSRLRSQRIVATRIITGSTLTFAAPRDLGVAQVRAFTMGDESTSARLSDSFLVRPAPHFASARARVRDGGVDVEVDGGGPGWVAVDVRDLAQHGGESSFRESFLGGRFRRAMLAPQSPADHALLASALAPFSARLPAAASANLERDARHRAREFRERGVARLYRYLEERLAADPQGVAEGTGPRRRFRSGVFGDSRGFAGRRVTPAQLQSADRSFSFESAARRRARAQLVRVLAAAVAHEDNVPTSARIISHLLQSGAVSTSDTMDPWGGVVGFRSRPAGVHSFFESTAETLAFPGPDGRLGTRDDIVDPFGRVVAEGTPYAVASGEDDRMRTISLMSVGGEALLAMARAFDRMTPAMREDYNGDAAHGAALTVDEGSIGLMGIGTIGHGGGSGYGRGAGGFGGRSSRTPRIRSGAASVAPMPGSSILGAVRDNLPGTVHFLPAMPTDAQGRARVNIDLPPSATTFLVEVIHWQSNGWRSSARTRFETHLPVAVQASSPSVATMGDVLRLPIRIANSTSEGERLRVSVDAGELAQSGEARSLDVAAGGRARTFVPLNIGTSGDGHIVIRALGAAGSGDRLRSAVHVRPRGLRREISIDEVHVHEAEIRIDAPARAEATLFVESGAAIYALQEPAWVAWGHVLAERQPRPAMMAESIDTLSGDDPLDGRALSVAWRSPELTDDAIREVIEAYETQGSLMDGVWLLGAAPALRDLTRRPAIRSALERFARVQIDGLIEAASEDTAKVELQALAAAILMTLGEPRHRAQAEEFARRVRREMVQVGSAVWVPESERGHKMWASAFLAYADVLLGELGEAGALIRTMSTENAEANVLTDIPRAMARVVAVRLGTARSVAIQTGAQERTLALEQGRGTQELTIAAGDTLRLQARGVFRAWLRVSVTQPWTSAEHSPLILERDEASEDLALDGRGEWTVRVRNRSPRMLRRTTVHIDLPAGATLESTCLERLRADYEATIQEGTLVLHLSALFPGRERRIPVALRFGAAGTMEGLGVYAFPQARPDAFAVHAPQRLEIGGGQ